MERNPDNQGLTVMIRRLAVIGQLKQPIMPVKSIHLNPPITELIKSTFKIFAFVLSETVIVLINW